MTCNTCNHEYETTTKQIGGIDFTYPPTCPKCAKSLAEKLEREAEADRIKAENERIKLSLIYSGIPIRRYPIELLQNYESKNPSQIVEWDFKKNIILAGGTGSGKTLKACVLGFYAITKLRKTVRYLTHSDMVSKIKDSWYSKITCEEAVIRELIECDILIIDELDKQPYSDYLFRVLNGRYNDVKPTIIIGNSDRKNAKEIADHFRQMMGDAVYSRFKEQGVVFKIFADIDYRLS